jgi:predicted cobalt transporter CbtA
MARKNKSLLGELGAFLMERKVWWLAPIIIMLILVGVLIIFSQSSALSPFIYALF